MVLRHILPRFCVSPSVPITLFLIMYCACNLPLKAQQHAPGDSLGHGAAGAQFDTTRGAPGVPAHEAGATRLDTLKVGYRPAKSTGLAMMFSAIIPGGGQVYNQSYWKVPVILGFGVYFVSEWLSNNKRYRDYRDQYSASLATFPVDNLRVLRDFYRDQRDAFAWYYLILYVINIADAYVDASLFDFNVGDDLSLRLLPGETLAGRQGVRLGITIGF